MPEYPEDGAWPGVRSPNLTREPLGTGGELTIGPDDLDPDRPRDREKLEEMGFDVVDYSEQDDEPVEGIDEETEADMMEGVDDWGLDWSSTEPLFDFGQGRDDENRFEPVLAVDPQSEDSDPFTLW